MRKVLSLLLVAAAVAFAAVSVAERPEGVAFSIDQAVPEPAVVSTPAGDFTSLSLPGAGFTTEPGAPMVPVIRRLIELPYGAVPRVEVRVARTELMVLDRPLCPRQPPVPKRGPSPDFVFDGKAYGRDAYLPEIGARVSEAGIARGHRLALVEITPVGYNPVRNTAEIAERMEVVVTWTAADWSLTRRQRERYDSRAFDGRLDGVVANPGLLAGAPPPDLPIGYLIIVPDAWEANIQPLARWRRQRGFDVFVRNLTQVGGNSAGVVQAYIRDAYDNWPVPPSFVLLVGDVDRIGYFTGQGNSNPPTDLNFAMVEGSDYFPDIDLSRASVATAAQLDSLVANIITYEQNTWSSGNGWLKKQYFIASADGGNHQTAEGTHAYVMAKLRPLGVECDSLWLYYGSGTPIVTAINGGRSWVTYSGHGGTDCWADPSPSFDVDAVHALGNVDMIPYVQTFACLSGDFSSTSYPECFSEAWIRSGRRGAIAHIASSVSSYWEEDDTLERRVFDCMFDSAFHWAMGGFNKAKLAYYGQMGPGDFTRMYFEMYNLMGDGAIDVYALEPEVLTVTHPPVIPIGSYPLCVQVSSTDGPVADALVCAAGVQDTTVHAVGYTDASGSVTLNVTTTAPDTVRVTVTGHDLAPYLGSALALPSSGPFVIYLRHEVDDSAGGNNDGIINPGETINLPLWVKNWGSAAAVGVVTTLRSSDPGVTLLDTVKSFGTIGAGDSAYTGPHGFGFTVAAACTNGYTLPFTVSTRDDNDSVWEAGLVLVVGAPVLDYASYVVDDPPPGGNGNRMVEPGENGELIVTLRNTGQGNAYDVTAVLRSGDSRLTVPDSVGAFGDIPRDSTGDNDGDRFRVDASASMPRETQVPCTLLVTVGGAQYTRVFMFDIGVIRTCDPIPDGPRTPPRYYAYDVTDTLYTEAPEYAWVEIGGVGTRLDLSDDETRQVNLPSGFGPFYYYGQAHSQLSICGNGWIAPGYTTQSTWTNTQLPDSAEPMMIAPWWDDLYPPEGGGVWYHHDEANHRFVIEWDSVCYFSPRDEWDKFEVVLYDTSVQTETGDNVILLQNMTANGTSSQSVGIDDASSTIGIGYVFDGSYHRAAAPFEPGMAIRVTTNPPVPRVGVAEGGSASLPSRVELHGCAPNPFRRGALVSFALPREGAATLSVFDAAGRRVARLVSGRVKAGRHSVRWDGTDGGGRPVASGVYLLRLEAGGAGISRKIVKAE